MPDKPMDWNNLADIGHAASHLTLASKGPETPFDLPTGVVPGGLVRAGLGMVGGRYLAAPLVKFLFPQLNEDAVNRIGAVGGGLLGAATSIPGIQTSGRRGEWFDKKSSWWTDTAAQRAIMNNVAEGNLSETDALQIYQKNREAEVGKTGLISGRAFTKALQGGARGYVNARVATSIAETLFSPKWTPKEQLRMAQSGGVAGALIGLLGSLSGSET